MERSRRWVQLKLVPPVARFGNIESAAELRVARLLDQVDLGEPATCFYSVHLPRHEYKRMSEIDFLLVLNDVVLVLEIKGGRLARRDGLWTFTDRYGEVHEKREGPFEQARTAMFAIEADLRRRIPGLGVAFGSVVITPDQALAPDLEWEPVEHLGPGSMTVAALGAGLTAAARHWRDRSRHTLGRSQYQDLVKALRPDFDRVPRLSLLASVFETDFVQLAAAQYDMLRGAEVNPRLLCTGGAGSGKTLLAVESARRAALGGETVLLTCRSPGVMDLMSRSLGDTSVDCIEWSQTAGHGPYDVVLVDEAQDILNTDDCLQLDELVSGGIREGRWRLFCDPNNQANVGGVFDRQTFDELGSSAAQFQLPYNCRNTSAIVQQTQLITGADLGVAKAGAGPAVEYVQPHSDTDTAALLDARLKRLRQEEIDLSEVVVVTLRDTASASSAVQTKAYSRGALTDQPRQSSTSGPAGAARLVTTRGFKGLEAAHVLVVDVDEVESDLAMARLYVAMTRPRVSLWIAVGPRAWAQLSSANGGKQ
ncbi:hypothetical protein ASE38_17105 [Cellulomonas sp. Root930]|nr:hypothetical protein ASE38_17105 [Cellulomonas sp. Root930]